MGRAATTAWTQHDVTLATQVRVAEGKSIQHVARALGRTLDDARTGLFRHGIYGTDGRNFLTDAQKEMIREMRWEGATYPAIAAVIGRTGKAVKAWCFKYGIVMKPKVRQVIAKAKAVARAEEYRKPKTTTSTRVCMCCRQSFTSKHIGNRRCQPCLSNAHTLDSPYAP